MTMPAPVPLVGIDLVEPPRLRDRLDRHADLRSELFTERELAYCEAQPAEIEHLAARWCAKEAVVKALKLDGFDPLDIEILTEGGAPELVLHGDAWRRAQDLDVTVSVSLTHVPDMAAAVALATPRALRSIDR
jgi:holo-[acyl-carrier protein] synthase